MALGGRRAVTGREVEKLVGHLTWNMMLRRDMLCLMSSLCEFIRHSYGTRQPLWASCLKELRWIKALLPMMAASMKKEWSATVVAFDASMYAYAVVEAEWALPDIVATGRLSERARFRVPLAEVMAPRSMALDTAVAKAKEAETLFVGRATGFTEVTGEAISEAHWRTVLCGRWRRHEPIHTLEGPRTGWRFGDWPEPRAATAAITLCWETIRR